MIENAAFIYATGVLGVIGFHIAMLVGAPWGELTMGGAIKGPYRGAQKLISVAQIIVIGVMGYVVLSHAGLITGALPAWAIWPVTAMAALSVLANAATRSPRERRLWLPVVSVMLVAVLIVAFGS